MQPPRKEHTFLYSARTFTVDIDIVYIRAIIEYWIYTYSNSVMKLYNGTSSTNPHIVTTGPLRLTTIGINNNKRFHSLTTGDVTCYR